MANNENDPGDKDKERRNDSESHSPSRQDRKRNNREDDEENDEDYDDEDDNRNNSRRRYREEESDNTGGLIPYKNPKALIAYYTGIFGFFVPIFGGLIAIILGILGLRYAKENPHARGKVHASIGIGCGLFCLLFWSMILVAIVISTLNKK